MERYKCADCDNIMQCEYYHNRKRTSKICSEFDNSFETIPKDQYETRLKADMVAMLKELIADVEEIEVVHGEPKICAGEKCMKGASIDLIQKKINELKGAKR